jgi:hypothetical protein
MKTFTFAFTLLAALLLATLAHADTMKLEVIDLHHRPAAEVIPIIQPFLAKGAVVRDAGGYQLIIRTTPENLAQIRQILQKVDTAPRRLLISVRQASAAAGTAGGADADVHLRPGDSQARVKVYGTGSRDQGDVTQRIQVLEGNAAFIHTGQSVPVGERNVFHGSGGTTIQDSVRYRDVTTGFYVYPRVNGDRVILRISPQKQNLSPEGGGRIDVQTAETTVSGRLGQWIDLGGTSGVSETQGSGITYRTAERDSRYGSIQVKVEEIKD